MKINLNAPICKLAFVLLFAAAFGGRFAQAQPLSNTNGLVGYWTGNGNAHDTSVNANNGAFSGSYATGSSGQAFNLTTGYVSIPHISAYNFTSGLSVGFWFYGVNPGDTNDAFVGDDNGPDAQNK